MGHCISDNTNNEERFKTVKLVSKHHPEQALARLFIDLVCVVFAQYEEEGDEPEFYTKKMNENVVH